MIQIPSIASKKDLKENFATYARNLVKKVCEGDKDKGELLKPKLAEFLRMISVEYKELSFYAGDDDQYDLKGGIMAVIRGDAKPGTPVTAYIFKDGLEEEKC